MEAITNFKFSKKGIIIIVLSVIVLLLIVAILYIVGKRQQEIAVSQLEPIEVVKESDVLLTDIFDDYRAGKFENVKQAIALSGLSTGTFYRKLEKYESENQ